MPRPELRLTFPVLLLAGLLFLPQAFAQDSPQKKLQDVEKQLEQSRQKQQELAKQADALASELQTLRDSEVKAAAAAQAHEAVLDGLDARLALLGADEKRKARELEQRRADEARLLMALALLARDPPEALAFSPDTPVNSVRGGILMGRALPPLEQRARDLGSQISSLRALRAEISSTEGRARAERAGLAREQNQISGLIAQKQALLAQTRQGAAESGKRQAALAAKASDLKDLIARLEDERAARDAQAARAASRPQAGETPAQNLAMNAPPPATPDPTRPRDIRPISQAMGHMAAPASGILVVHFGDVMQAGAAPSKGLTFETRSGAQVVAPFDGKVLFAGPFKGYGQILIIGHGDGYHSLLAGLDRVDASVGQWLVAGEPVGVMSQGSQKPRLYLELRHDGQPINPLPWLAIRDEKVNG
ncbi:MAG: peptidoglycan DD-metalloendopeptidase family protein [Stellaceae bacterium]